MTRVKVARSLLAAALLSAVGCSLAVDASDVDRGCGAGRKLCGTGNCVAQDDPAYGCTVNHCEPCALMNATAGCSDHACVVKDCLLGFGCPNDQVGCPTNIFVDADNCGVCHHACDNASCRDGVCVSH